jgi:hypothetical protein
VDARVNAGIIVCVRDYSRRLRGSPMPGHSTSYIIIALFVASIAIYGLRQKVAAKWDEKKRNTFDILVGVALLGVVCAIAGNALLKTDDALINAKSEVASSCRDLWKRVKPMPLGTELTTIGLDQLRVHLQHDEVATRAALGEEEYAALKEKLELDDLRKTKVADLQKQMTDAQAELDRVATELKDSTKRLEKLEEIQPAVKAFQEGRRTAPQGPFQIEIKIKKTLVESEDLGGALLRTRLECLRTDKHTEESGISTYVFTNVSKEYAAEVQKRFKGLDATVTVSESIK